MSRQHDDDDDDDEYRCIDCGGFVFICGSPQDKCDDCREHEGADESTAEDAHVPPVEPAQRAHATKAIICSDHGIPRFVTIVTDDEVEALLARLRATQAFERVDAIIVDTAADLHNEARAISTDLAAEAIFFAEADARFERTMRNVTIADILTPEEMVRVQRLWLELKGTGRFAAVVEQDVILPNVTRIRAAIGEDSAADSLANWIEAACGEADRVAGRLWELGDDLCHVCSAYLGRRLRFMHLGLCDTCRRAPKH